MLTDRGTQTTGGPTLRSIGGLAVAVLHYAICALAITIGLLATFSGLMASVFDVEVRGSAGWTMVGWITVSGIFVGELIYRPSFKVASAGGFVALLIWCSFFAVAVLISLIFN